MIDTHCHFDFAPFCDVPTQALQQAQAAGVTALIVPAVNAERIAQVLALAQQHAAIYAAVGLHPIYPHQSADLDLLAATLAQHHTDDKLVAIGEIGLDAWHQAADLAQQQQLLHEQLALARHYQLPVILHSRKTHAQLYQLLKQAKLPQTGVLHGYSGSFEQAMQFVKLGYKIGVGGVITYPRANKTRQAIAALPLESLLLETDAPDMPLNGFQGEANRPERLAIILSTLAELRPEPLTQIAQTIEQTTRELFAIKT